jgi:hypothetical protein
MRYIKLVKLELFKTRKSYTLFLIIGLGIFLEGFYALSLDSRFLVNAELNTFINKNQINKWFGVFNFHMELVTILSLIMIFIPIILMQTEYRNRMEKHLKVLPVTQFDIFLSKFFVLITILFLTIILLSIFKGLGAYLSNWNHPYINDSFFPTIFQQIYIAIRLWLSHLSLLSLLLLINFKIKNLVLSVIISVVFWITSFIPFFYFLPFAYPQASQSQLTMTLLRHGTIFNFVVFKYEIYSIIFTILILYLAENLSDKKELITI